MRKPFSKSLLCVSLVLCTVTVGGAYAGWSYSASPADEQRTNAATAVGAFQYGRTIYIANAEVVGGAYQDATIEKTADVAVTVDGRLRDEGASTVQMEVLFYNSVNASYYYDETLVALDNGNIRLTVTGLEQKQEVKAKTYARLLLTFSYENGTNISSANFTADLQFKFAINSEDIGGVVAETAIERFEDIINNEAAADSFEQLTTAMDDRGNAFNKASSVTYIGNVAGASTTDSNVLVGLFGSELMEMDLDGDGTPEPITMMVKRENLDGDTTTGSSYTYSGLFGRETTVDGVEMTLYITADSFEGKNQGDEMTVYAAVYTLLPNATEWTQILPLTQGFAEANNYTNGGYGEANSFNTDTWYTLEGTSKITIEALVQR